MRKVGFSFVLIICLILPVPGFEKVGENPLDEEPEILIGKVKKITVTTTGFNKVAEQWVVESKSSITRKFPQNPEPEEADSEDSASSAKQGEENFPEDPIKAQQSEGYNAGYGSSHADYGFYKIDEKQNILEAAHYSYGEKLVEKDYYTYDVDGKEIEKITIKGDGSFAGRVITSYNSQGKRIQRATYAKDGRLEEVWNWQCDENNNITLETFHHHGSLKYRASSTYHYDKKGNYTRKKTIEENFDNSILTSQTMCVRERTISYYEK